MAIGRPLNLTANVASKVISAIATASQTQFTVTGGYRINELAVYRNGIRLVNEQDYTATDGSAVTLTQAATLSDIFEFQVFDLFNIADAVNTSGDSTINGNLTVNGTLTATATTATTATTASGLSGSVTSSGPLTISDSTASTSSSTGALIVTGGVGIGKSLFVSEGISVGGTITYDDVTNVDSIGIVTAGGGLYVGRTSIGATFTTAGDAILAGVVTATRFFGDGSNLTGVDSTALKDSNDVVRVQANTSGAVVTGIVTATTFIGALTGDASGSAAGLTGTPDITVRNITGVAATFTGVLTYEDVTNVDSVGIVTARSGVNVTGGYYRSHATAIAALAIDCSAGNYFTKTIASGNQAFTFSSVPANPIVYSMTVEVTHTSGSGTITWPSEVKWPGDTAPSLTDGKTTLFMFVTDDGGTRWRGSSLANYTN